MNVISLIIEEKVCTMRQKVFTSIIENIESTLTTVINKNALNTKYYVRKMNVMLEDPAYKPVVTKN